MGRDTGSLRVDKKPNVGKVDSSGVSCGTNHTSSGESVKIREGEVQEGPQVETSYENQEAEVVKTTNQEAVSPRGKTPKPEPSKSTEKIISSLEENVTVGLHISSNTSSFHSPIITKQLQNSPFSIPRAQKSYTDKYHDEDDNWSLASSAATSRTVKSRVTVGVAPSFRSAQRAEQRKEFYSKLEQKHEALKAKKMEYEARNKEEQEEAIKQLRKTMVVKANPVPTFYRQGPPPKVELKKLPVTRPKSPNLTRRKSCGDANHSTMDAKALCSRVRHSIGTYKTGSATSSPIKQPQSRNISKPKDRTSKTKQGNETPKVSPLKEPNPDVTVQS